MVKNGEIDDLSSLTLQCYLNGEEIQSASTSGMVFTPGQVIEHVSRFMPLFPGDIVLLGRPPMLEDKEYGVKFGDKVTSICSEIGEVSCLVSQQHDEFS
mmetsp:Transcript_14734/g.22905  ORF Transcript_14734/g.22905 Transcript_14734/m.22905 type:complete len:99 (-) Transcript_14734:21-317(-)